MRRHLRRAGSSSWTCGTARGAGHWSAAAVLEVSDNGVDLIRRADPTVDAEGHRVSVRYDFTVRKEAETVDDFVEVHEVRFFFAEELERLLGDSGFEMVCLAAFPPSTNPRTRRRGRSRDRSGGLTVRIVLVSSVFPPRLNAEGDHVVHVARDLAAEGHEVHVLTTRGATEVDGMTVHPLDA